MSNELGMAMQQAILALKARCWSHRRIAREMGIHRETVGRYLSLAAKPTINPPAESGLCLEFFADEFRACRLAAITFNGLAQHTL